MAQRDRVKQTHEWQPKARCNSCMWRDTCIDAHTLLNCADYTSLYVEPVLDIDKPTRKQERKDYWNDWHGYADPDNYKGGMYC